MGGMYNPDIAEDGCVKVLELVGPGLDETTAHDAAFRV